MHENRVWNVVETKNLFSEFRIDGFEWKFVHVARASTDNPRVLPIPLEMTIIVTGFGVAGFPSRMENSSSKCLFKFPRKLIGKLVHKTPP